MAILGMGKVKVDFFSLKVQLQSSQHEDFLLLMLFSNPLNGCFHCIVWLFIT